MKVRIRFETRNIAPSGVPDFIYVPSKLSFGSLHYTALVEHREDEEPKSYVSAIRQQWPDAIIHCVEMNAPSFMAMDLEMRSEVYGTFDREKEVKRPGFWSRLGAVLVPYNDQTKVIGRRSGAPGMPEDPSI